MKAAYEACKRGGRLPLPAPKNFAYEEKLRSLEKRIQAHSRYSNFNLHEWIEKKFPLKPGESLLDLGCGTGNYTSLFWKKVGPGGFILSLDKNEEMVREAQKRFSDLPSTRVSFLVRDFDKPLDLPHQNFQWIFSIYSLYYTSDSRKIVKEMEQALAPGGSFVAIGPAPNNALELIELTRQITGRQPKPENAGRLSRLLLEFKPLLKECFSFESIEEEILESRMEFPTAQTFCDYYFSTILWRDTTTNFSEEKCRGFQEEILQWAASSLPVKIQKQITCLVAKKRYATQ